MKILLPPRLPGRIIQLLCKDQLVEEVLGDLFEYYNTLEDHPRWRRNIFYWFHAFTFMRPILIKRLSGNQKLNYYGMFKLNFKLAFRAILKHRLVSGLSLVSLVFGIVCFHLIYVWIANELDMDRFHQNVDRIHISTVRTNPNADLTPMTLQLMFRLDFNQFPEVDKTLLIHVYREGEIKLEVGNREYEGRAFVADSTFFDFFDFEVEDGTENLKDPSHIIITRSFANKVFGPADPIGKTVRVRCDQVGTYKVAGILEKIPSNSSISFDFVIPRHSQRFWRRIPQEFFLANASFDRTAFNKKIQKMGRETNTRFPESILSASPMADHYFDHSLNSTVFSGKGDLSVVYTMAFIAMMIWVITLFGFTNLQSTLQLSNMKQTGIKQVLGGSRMALISEVLMSKLYFMIISVLLVSLMLSIVFPHYTYFMDLQIDRHPARELGYIGVSIFLIMGISMIFSSIRMRRIKTKEVLLGVGQYFRVPQLQRFVTTIQYTITIILIIATSVVYAQLNYMMKKDIGFKYSNVVQVDFFEMLNGGTTDDEMNRRQSQFAFIGNELDSNPIVAGYSQGDMPITHSSDMTSWKRIGDGYSFTSENRMIVDPNYRNLLGLEVVEGRFFSDSLDQNDETKVMINEAARKYWNIEDIQNTQLSSNTSGRTVRSFDIIGVVKDYHYEHLSNKIKPLVLQFRPYQDDPFMIRFEEGKEKQGIEFLQKLYHIVNPKGIFNYELLQKELEAQYDSERRLGSIYMTFTLIALILSSMSMFTFSYYETRRRTKEIGIRRVNGANFNHIFSLLSFSFMRSILVAFLIASPLAWYLTRLWLDNFQNRIQIRWEIFLLSGLTTLIIAFMVIIWQTSKISRANPVDSLRYE